MRNDASLQSGNAKAVYPGLVIGNDSDRTKKNESRQVQAEIAAFL